MTLSGLSGPLFERSGEFFRVKPCRQCGLRQDGAHYNQFEIIGGIAALRCIFPTGEANELNFCLFSTSGVHGTYASLEQIEASLRAYPDGPPEGDDWPDNYCLSEVTVLIVQPRLCCLRYGNIAVTLADLPYLKRLRQSSWQAVQKIGAEASQQ